MVSPDEWQQVQSRGGAVDLSRSVKLRLSGPDALRYLNGQVTNDIRRLTSGGDAMPACLCNHKGKLEAFVMISRTAEGTFLITADESLGDFLPLRLEKYLIADDALLEDVTNDYTLIHTWGEAAAPFREQTGVESLAFPANRFGEAGLDFWLPARSAAPELPFTPARTLETLRIDRGIPAWEPDLSAGILPPEAGLDTFAIDYHKGCYTGQEVISRIRSVGKVNRLLLPFIAAGGASLEAGWELSTLNAGGQPVAVGHLTSAAWHPTLQTGIALGYLKRGAPGILHAGPPGAPPVAVVESRKTLDD